MSKFWMEETRSPVWIFVLSWMFSYRISSSRCLSMKKPLYPSLGRRSSQCLMLELPQCKVSNLQLWVLAHCGQGAVQSAIAIPMLPLVVGAHMLLKFINDPNLVQNA